MVVGWRDVRWRHLVLLLLLADQGPLHVVVTLVLLLLLIEIGPLHTVVTLVLVRLLILTIPEIVLWHLVLLLLLVGPGPLLVVVAMVLVRLLIPTILDIVLWHLRRVALPHYPSPLVTLEIPPLERERALLGWDVPLVHPLGSSPGDAEPTAKDGNALHLAHGHLGVATLHVLDERGALVGPVHVGDLAELLEPSEDHSISHAPIDAADEQRRVRPINGVRAVLVL